MAPVPLPLAGRVHRAMRDFVAGAGTRRALPTTMHVGAPEGQHVDIPVEPWQDPGLRTELVARALAGLEDAAFEHALPWVTRTGGHDTHDTDLHWCAAARSSFGRFGLELPGFFVVTRQGWSNLLTGEVHRWDRVRPARYRD